MNPLDITKPTEATQAERAAQGMLTLAQSYEIDSTEMYQAAGVELQTIAKRAREIEAQRVHIKEPFLEGGRRIDAFFKAPLDFLKQAEQLLKSRMVTFQSAERAKADQLRREAEQRAREEREEQARIQREAEAEQRRIREEAAAAERQAQAEAEEARRAGDEAAARAIEEANDAALREAQQNIAAAAEVAESAAAAIEIADVAPVFVPAVVMPAAAGVSTRQNWKHEVTCLADLVCHAADKFRDGDPTFLAYLAADPKSLGQAAKSLKAQARIPGVRVYSEDSLAVRTAA